MQGLLKAAPLQGSVGPSLRSHAHQGAQLRRPVPSRAHVSRRQQAIVASISASPLPPKSSSADPWERVIAAEKNGEILQVRVKSFNKGGLIVMLGELKGFMPYTCMANETLRKGHLGDLSYLVGKTLRAKIVSVDMQSPKREIIFSEKKAQQSDAMRLLKVGATVRGVVSAVEEYGAFVELSDLPGVSGLVHKTELSWEPVMTVDAMLTKGQTITAKVIELDTVKCRLALSIKQLTEDPTKKTLDRIEWGITRNMMLEVQKLVERLQAEEGVEEVYIGRQAQERSITSQELGVYLTREEVANGYNVVCRLGNTAQELLVTTKMNREQMKETLARAARGV